MKENEFIQHYIANAPQIMWFLGAGTSRTAGMPTATDIIWDLKRSYYCHEERQDIQKHDINKQTIKDKIQQYMDSKGFPPLWSTEEYSFYFQLMFKYDYTAQHAYLNEQLNSEKISLNVGHRALAALVEMAKAKLIFTTNFDEVIERSYSAVIGKPLSTFHLEGSYAALQALNSEKFPIYAKLHGDFRYKSLKNLEQDLKTNDEEIQKCFLNACSRYGLVVVGYSGRDQNVMDMLNSAIDAGNPFPQGLFWAVPSHANITPAVNALITKAQTKGIKAAIVEIDTFDSLLSRIWLQTSNRPQELDKKVQNAKSKVVNIALPAQRKSFPILKTNAFEIVKWPNSYKTIQYRGTLTLSEIRFKQREARAKAIITKNNEILAWGDTAEINKFISAEDIGTIGSINLSNNPADFAGVTVLQSFLEEGIANALVENKPLQLRRGRTSFYVVINVKQDSSTALQPLKTALAYNDKPGYLHGKVPGLSDTTWIEAVEVRIEIRNGRMWLLLRPDIWITPQANREQAIAFLRDRKRYRYNPKSDAVLNAWIEILLGNVEKGTEVTVALPNTEGNALNFVINNCAAFSGRG